MAVIDRTWLYLGYTLISFTFQNLEAEIGSI